MNMENLARLSYYQELAPVKDQAHITLVMKTDTEKIYVKKVLHEYKKDIYELVMREKPKYFPKIYEIVEDDDTLYVIEEYVNGDTLEEYMEARGTLELDEAKRVMQDICAGVEFLHRQIPAVIHRDLKPGNVMLDKDGLWKIVDLNTARYYAADAARDTEYLGTKDFAAPEQFGFKQTDVRTDIYALGLLFHYMLTGTSPVQQMCPGRAGEIVQKCIMFEPDRRYQSVAALLQDIEEMGTHRSLDRMGSIHRKRVGFCPPGFRTGKLWKMLIAILGYAFLIWVCFTMEVTNGAGVPAVGIELLLNRLVAFVWLLLTILIWFNYRDIQGRLPLLRSGKRWLKLAGCIIYSMVILSILLVLLAVFFS